MPYVASKSDRWPGTILSAGVFVCDCGCGKSDPAPENWWLVRIGNDANGSIANISRERTFLLMRLDPVRDRVLFESPTQCYKIAASHQCASLLQAEFINGRNGSP